MTGIEITLATTILWGSITVGQVVATVALSALSTVISMVASEKPSRPRDPGVPVTVREPISPRKRYYGRTRASGSIVFAQLINNRKNLLLVMAVSEGPVRGPQKLLFDDEVVWERTGTNSNGDLANVGSYLDDWGDYVHAEFYDGTQNTASSYFVSKSGGEDRPNDQNVSTILTEPSNIQVSTATETIDRVRFEDEEEVIVQEEVTVVTASWSHATGGTVVEYLVHFEDKDGNASEKRVPGDENSVRLGVNAYYDELKASIKVAAKDTSGNWTEIINESGESEPRTLTWDSSRVGEGVAYIALDLKWDKKRKKFPRGIPNITMVLDGASDVYDPRTGTTGWTRNAALCLRHYILDTVIGLGAPQVEVDDDSFIAHANLSDETVTDGAGLSEPRYRIDGFVEADEKRADVMTDMAAAMASDVVWATGQFKMIGGEVPPVTMSITDADLMGPVRTTIGRGRREEFNAVKGTHQPKETNYISTDFPVVVESGATLPYTYRDLPLRFTQSVWATQRLARIALAEGNKKIFPVISLPAEAAILEVGDTLQWDSARYSWGAQLFRVESVREKCGPGEISEDGTVVEPIFEVELSEADAAAFQELASDAIAEGDTRQISPPSALVQAPTNVAYEHKTGLLKDGSLKVRTVVTWQEADDPAIRGYEVSYSYDDGIDSQFTEALSLTVEKAVTDVYVRTVNNAGLVSAWVPASLVGSVFNDDTTAPPTPTTSAVEPLTVGAGGEVVAIVDESPASDFKVFRLYANAVSSYSDVTDTGTNTEYVTSLFNFYFGRDPAQEGLNFWVNQLDTAQMTREQVANSFATAAEDAVLVDTSASTTLRAEGFDPNTEYSFYVTAVDRSGNESAGLSLGSATPDPVVGVDGQDGKNVALIYIYRRAANQPSSPSGGSFDFGTLILTPPTGWYATPPSSNGDPLWVASTTAATTDPDGVVSLSGWSTPAILAQDGSDGTSAPTTTRLEIFQRAASQPAAPSGGSFDIGTGVLTPPSGWSIDDPGGSDPLWATFESFTYSTTTGTVAGGTWSTPVKRAEDGTDGLNGISATQLRVWKRASSAPGTPTGGSYTFSTDSLSPPSGWSTTPPDSTGDPADVLYVSVATASVTLPDDTDSSLTWSAPTIEARDGQDGEPGVDGVDGGVAQVYVYKRQTTRPDAPVDGEFDFANVNLIVPSGWSETIPEVNPDAPKPLWISNALVSRQGTTGPSDPGDDTVILVDNWTAPKIYVREQGPPAGLVPVYADDANGTNPSLTQGSRTYVGYVETRNLLQFGRDLTDSEWLQSNITPSANVGSGFDGQSLADSISITDTQDTTSFDLLYQGVSRDVSRRFTMSAYVDSSTTDVIQLGFGLISSGNWTTKLGGLFNLDYDPQQGESLITADHVGTPAEVTEVAVHPDEENGMTRISVAGILSNTSATDTIYAYIGIDTAHGNGPVKVDALQFEPGGVATPYRSVLPVPNGTTFNRFIGDDGKSVFKAKIFKRAASQPTKPADDAGSYDFGTDTLTPPSGWSDTPPAQNGDPLWASYGTFSAPGLDGIGQTVVWSTPEQDAGEGADGTSSFMVEVYLRSDTTLTSSIAPQPGEGHFDFSEPDIQNALDFSATGDQGGFTWEHKNGWRPFLSGIGTGKKLYVCRALASAPGNGVDTSLSWTGPFQIAEDGDDAASGARGAGRWYVPVSSLPSNASEAENAWNAWADRPGEPVPRDQAIFYTGTASNHTAQKAFIYDGDFDGDWIEQAEVIDGNLLIAGTLTADKVYTATPGSSSRIEINREDRNLVELFNSNDMVMAIGAEVPQPGDIRDTNSVLWADTDWGGHLIEFRHNATFATIEVWNQSTNVNAKTMHLKGEAGSGDVMLIESLDETTRGLRVYDSDPLHGDSYPNFYGTRRTDEHPLVSIAGERQGGNLQVFQNGIGSTRHAAAFHGRHDQTGATSGTEPAGGAYDNSVTHGGVSYGAVAILANGSGNAFYAEAGNYAPFTGEHETLVAKTETQPEPGDILVDVEVIARRGMSNVTVAQTLANQVADTRVIGVLDRPLRDIDIGALPNAVKHNGWTLDQAEALIATYRMSGVNSLGEGQINVCGRNGDIQAGDLIVSSDLPGKGQRQNDDIMRASTVAKARESVTFDHPDQVKTIACTYHCG